jgi:gluconolactonase
MGDRVIGQVRRCRARARAVAHGPSAALFVLALIPGCTSSASDGDPGDAAAEGGSEGVLGSADAAHGDGSGGAGTGGAGTGGTGGSGTAGGGMAGAAGSSPATGGTAGAGPSAEGGPGSPWQAACSPGQSYGDPLPEDRAATLVTRGFGFVEGPVWVAEAGVLFFSDMDFGGGDATGPPSVIRRMHLSGEDATFDVLTSSGSNGLALANDGRILAATHDVQSLSYFDTATGEREDWPLLLGTAHFNSPNDLVVRSDGNVYFTDPDWQLGSRTSETGVEGVYRVSPSGSVSTIDDGFDKPNGITLSPDEQTLYVGGRTGGIYRFTLDAAGVPSGKTEFAAGATDGMTVDCAGNVYVTRGDVIVLDASGSERGRITLDREPSNVAFGGTDRKTLFITAGDSLFRIDLNVPGMPY